VLLFLLTGAGFGGCTVNLVDGEAAEAFARALAAGYTRKDRAAARDLHLPGRGWGWVDV